MNYLQFSNAAQGFRLKNQPAMPYSFLSRIFRQSFTGIQRNIMHIFIFAATMVDLIIVAFRHCHG
jgi:hypothetical protein